MLKEAFRQNPEILFHPDVLSKPYKISVNPTVCTEVLIAAGINTNLTDRLKIVIADRPDRRRGAGVYCDGLGEIYIYTGTQIKGITSENLSSGKLSEELNYTLAHESSHASDDSSLNMPHRFLRIITAIVLNFFDSDQEKEREAKAFADKLRSLSELRAIAAFAK